MKCKECKIICNSTCADDCQYCKCVKCDKDTCKQDYINRKLELKNKEC